MAMKKRLDPATRRAVIAQAAAKAARRHGLMMISHESAATECGVPTSVATVRHYFRTLADLRVAAVEYDPALKGDVP
jgi:DNA-binding transcriptional regulator YbjK